MIRLLLVLFTLLSLATAQCGNSCTCGNSACCQSSGSPYTDFNFGYGQQYSYGQQARSVARQNSRKPSCLKTSPLLIPIAEIAERGPQFTLVIEDTDDNRQLDNICTTYFPLPDDSSTYIIYDSFVFSDGSNEVISCVVTDIGPGTSTRGNAYFTYIQRMYSSFGNNLYIGCNEVVYGESNLPTVFALTFGNVISLGSGCIQQIENIVQCVGLGELGGLYKLPYRQPTRCFTRQVCSLVNPLLYASNNYAYKSRCRNGRC